MRTAVATYVIGNPGYHRATEAIPGVPYPKAVRDYDAVELVGRKLLDRNWALTASYVWSRLYGNYSGLSQSDENGRTDPNIGIDLRCSAGAVRWRRSTRSTGALATDRPHQAKAQLIYTAPFGVNLGALPVGGQRAAREPLRRAVAGHRAGRSTPAGAATAARRCCRRPISACQYVAAARRTQAADSRAERAQPLQPGPGCVALQPRNRPGRAGRGR